MPELPEVESIANSLYPHVAGAVFTGANLLRESSLHPLSLPLQSLADWYVHSVSRRGKLLIFNLKSDQHESERSLVAHLRMTGRLLTRPADAQPGKHTRCVFGLKMRDGSCKQLFFDDIRAFGVVFAATPDLLAKWQFWATLGPEPLEIDCAGLASRLKGKRPLKTALMDQRVIAGIGNIYADESLFQAGISPLREAGSLADPEIENLHSAIQDILKRSISQCGSSIRDYVDANGNAGAFQNTFRVYGRGGKKCTNCGKELVKTKLSGRATVYCENCQK